jgi:hypothetical protein
VVFTHTDIFACDYFGNALSNNDLADAHFFAVGTLDAEVLWIRIA